MIVMPKIDCCCWIYDRSEIFFILSFPRYHSLCVLFPKGWLSFWLFYFYMLTIHSTSCMEILFAQIIQIFSLFVFYPFLDLALFFSTHHRQITKYEYKNGFVLCSFMLSFSFSLRRFRPHYNLVKQMSKSQNEQIWNYLLFSSKLLRDKED